VNQLHFGLIKDEKLVASVILKKLSNKAFKLRQMIVDESARGQGFGSKLIKHVEAKLQKMGVKTIEMAARYTAKGFYEKMGYAPVGDIFTEVGIDHIKMVKTL
jgi:predicted GNAT family N-acyltransferase